MPTWTVTSANLARLGPVIDLRLGVASAQEAALQATGSTVPSLLPLTALIDTGASHTAIQQNLAIRLGLQPMGYSTVQTASHTNHFCPLYAAQLLFPQGVAIELSVIEMPLQAQNIQCLIGRDVLADAVLVYLGESNLFSLSF